MFRKVCTVCSFVLRPSPRTADRDFSFNQKKEDGPLRETHINQGKRISGNAYEGHLEIESQFKEKCNDSI
jgi:hypothetical protein